MIKTELIPTRSRTTLVSGDNLLKKPRRMLAVMSFALVLLAGFLAGGPLVYAQQQQAKAEPAVATVNINTADAQTLAASLKGVGELRANEIVRYREAYGPFASVDELTEVKGIGKSTLDMNRQAITLE
jgi:competence protein ComEA